ncbi:Glutathione S-transferase protein [Sesbania bispinosa]|nr:Glutathione S-transferase protein [Sesbania bispinosa]
MVANETCVVHKGDGQTTVGWWLGHKWLMGSRYNGVMDKEQGQRDETKASREHK